MMALVVLRLLKYLTITLPYKCDRENIIIFFIK